MKPSRIISIILFLVLFPVNIICGHTPESKAALIIKPGDHIAVASQPGTGFYDHCGVGVGAQDMQGGWYFVTAGHCFKNHSTREALNVTYVPTLSVIGYEFYRNIPTRSNEWDDFSVVKLNPGITVASLNYQRAPKGLYCIITYQHSTSRCGPLIQRDDSTRYNNTGIMYTVNHLSTAGYCAIGGDSGSEVFTSDGPVGVHVAASDTAVSCRSQFEPIEVIGNKLSHLNPPLHIIK